MRLNQTFNRLAPKSKQKIVIAVDVAQQAAKDAKLKIIQKLLKTGGKKCR